MLFAENSSLLPSLVKGGDDLSRSFVSYYNIFSYKFGILLVF